MKEIECPRCHGTGKVSLKKDDIINGESDSVTSVPPEWFEEYEDLQNKIKYHVYLLEKRMRSTKNKLFKSM